MMAPISPLMLSRPFSDPWGRNGTVYRPAYSAEPGTNETEGKVPHGGAMCLRYTRRIHCDNGHQLPVYCRRRGLSVPGGKA